MTRRRRVLLGAACVFSLYLGLLPAPQCISGQEPGAPPRMPIPDPTVDIEFRIGAPRDPDDPEADVNPDLIGVPGGEVEVCYYYMSSFSFLGFVMATNTDCRLHPTDYRLGGILDVLDPEFINVDFDDFQNDPVREVVPDPECEAVFGVQLESVPGFSGRMIPATRVLLDFDGDRMHDPEDMLLVEGPPLELFCVTYQLDATITCESDDLDLDLSFVALANGTTAAPNENIVAIPEPLGIQSEVPYVKDEGTERRNARVRVPLSGFFIRADCNLDGEINTLDGIACLRLLFRRWQTDCPEACDFDDNDRISILDAVGILAFVFSVPGSHLPRPPFPNCGPDPDPDDRLPCGTAPVP